MERQDLTDASIAFRVINRIIKTDGNCYTNELPSGAKNSFTVVRNYLANVIAENCSL